MSLITLLLTPLIGVFYIYTISTYKDIKVNIKKIKIIGLSTLVINLILSLLIYLIFDYSSNQYQFVQEYYNVSSFDFFLGLDGLSVYFVLLTTIIMPVSLLSN